MGGIMMEAGRSLEKKLLEEYFRHHLAHSAKVASGTGQRGCQFCPTLKINTGGSQRGLMRAEVFPQRFYRTLAKDLNKIHRMSLSGHLEATRFMRDLEQMVKEMPWDKPPASPGAILAAPIA